MILVLNAIVDTGEAGRFDAVVLPGLGAGPRTGFEVVHLSDTAPLPLDFQDHERLLISGSELSAASRHERDDEVEAMIRAFVATGKPVLGICYGFQMLARALGGRERCRRAALPEFGWKALQLHGENPLFAGLERVVTMHSHYDEVTDLGPDFKVLASTADCQVQAAQFRDLPVWGVQFHPELGYREGERMLESNLRSEPLAPELAGRELESPQEADANLRILHNFLRAQPVEVAA